MDARLKKQMIYTYLKSLINVFEYDRNMVMMAFKELYDQRNETENKKKEAEKLKNKKNPTDDDFQKILDAIEIYKEEIKDLREEQKRLRI